MNLKSKKPVKHGLKTSDLDRVRFAVESPADKRNKSVTKPKEAKLKFGSVTLVVRGLRDSEARRNIKAGQTALARAMVKITKPGVKIDVYKHVPLFHADPENPKLIIRELNGKRARGVLIKGKFKTSR